MTVTVLACDGRMHKAQVEMTVSTPQASAKLRSFTAIPPRQSIIGSERPSGVNCQCACLIVAPRLAPLPLATGLGTPGREPGSFLTVTVVCECA